MREQMDTHELRSILEDALAEHLANRIKISATETARPSDHSKARASGLGTCALKTAYDRALDPKMGINLALLLAHGTQIGQLYQDAMIAYASRHAFISADVEVVIDAPTVVGKVDLLVSKFDPHTMSEDSAIVEIKYTSKQDGSGGDIRPHYALQLLSYLSAIPAHPYLMTVGKGNADDLTFRLWKMVLDPYVGGYYLVDEEGERFKARWNDPAYLNMATVLALSYEQINYGTEVEAALANNTNVLPPFADPLNDSAAWQCLKIETKRNVASPKCPHAGRCWGVTGETPFEKTDEGRIWSPVF
jgi:hypothetical protein